MSQGPPPGTVRTMSRGQQLVARRMAESAATIPAFTLRRSLDASPLLRYREAYAGSPRPTVNDLVVWAAAGALRSFRDFNVVWYEGTAIELDSVAIGIAISTPRGLVAPVVQIAEGMTMADFVLAARGVVGRAATGTLSPEDFSPAALTVSNLGMYGVDGFEGIVSPGQSAILTVGAIVQRPVVVGGKVAPRPTVECNLSVDHRPLNGDAAATWFHHFAEHLTSMYLWRRVTSRCGWRAPRGRGRASEHMSACSILRRPPKLASL